jgi:putative heme iron utilization protein
MILLILLTVILAISLVGNVLLYNAANRQLLRVEEYEKVVADFYSKTSLILHTIRHLDEKQMFESDDEVGSVFAQIVDAVNELRPLVYGVEEDATTEEN